MDKLEYLEVNHSNEYDKVIVFIHGWKGNKDSFTSLSSMLKIKNTKWFFPQAPYKLNEKKEAYSWAFQNSDGTYETTQTVKLLNKFLEENILNTINSKNVFFIGFSQGATVCYDFILQMGYPWGGVFPVAGFKRNQKKCFTVHPNQIKTPIMIGHGINDKIIPIESSENIYQELKQNNYNVSFEKFNGGHKISINYLKKIQHIITGLFLL